MRPTPQPHKLSIEPYESLPAGFEEHNPKAAQVAGLVAAALRVRMPSLRVEHVGSTAVPGCAGKGIVDLAILYAAGQLACTRALLDELGFQRQTGPDPFPEDRPMRVGALKCDGRTFRLHAHVVSATAPEAAELLAFRDRLRGDPVLREAYVARRREIIAGGVSDSLDYCYAKSAFVERTLRGGGESASSIASRAKSLSRASSAAVTSGSN